MDMRFRVEYTLGLCCFKILMYLYFYGGPEQFKYEHYNSLIFLSTYRRFCGIKKIYFKSPVLIYTSYIYNADPLEWMCFGMQMLKNLFYCPADKFLRALETGMH